MGKLEESHVPFFHVFVQVADGGGDTPSLCLETTPLEESSPVPFKTVDVPVSLDRKVLENLPLLKLSEESMIDYTFVDNVELEKLVYEFVVDEFTENSPGNHLERKDGNEFLGLDDQFVVLLVPDNMREARQGCEPFVGVADHDGKEFGGFLCGEVWVDVGSESSPIFIMLHTDGVAKNPAHVFPKANVGDLKVDLGITVVVSTDVIGVAQNAFNGLFQRKPWKPNGSSYSHFRDIATEYSIQRAVLLAVFGHHARSFRQTSISWNVTGTGFERLPIHEPYNTGVFHRARNRRFA